MEIQDQIPRIKQAVQPFTKSKDFDKFIHALDAYSDLVDSKDEILPLLRELFS